MTQLQRDVLLYLLDWCDDRSVLGAEQTCKTIRGVTDPIWETRSGELRRPADIPIKRWYWCYVRRYYAFRNSLPDYIQNWFDENPRTVGEAFCFKLRNPFQEDIFLNDPQFGPLWRVRVFPCHYKRFDSLAEGVAIAVESQRIIGVALYGIDPSAANGSEQQNRDMWVAYNLFGSLPDALRVPSGEHWQWDSWTSVDGRASEPKFFSAAAVVQGLLSRGEPVDEVFVPHRDGRDYEVWNGLAAKDGLPPFPKEFTHRIEPPDNAQQALRVRGLARVGSLF